MTTSRWKPSLPSLSCAANSGDSTGAGAAAIATPNTDPSANAATSHVILFIVGNSFDADMPQESGFPPSPRLRRGRQASGLKS